jgi:hypothetical protein
VVTSVKYYLITFSFFSVSAAQVCSNGSWRDLRFFKAEMCLSRKWASESSAKGLIAWSDKTVEKYRQSKAHFALPGSAILRVQDGAGLDSAGNPYSMLSKLSKGEDCDGIMKIQLGKRKDSALVRRCTATDYSIQNNLYTHLYYIVAFKDSHLSVSVEYNKYDPREHEYVNAIESAIGSIRMKNTK